MRAGFTLIEALVALVLFQIAALALAATTAVAARDLAVAHRHARANAIALERVARFKAGACAGFASGSEVHPGGFEERWTVVAAAQARTLTDSVAFDLTGGKRGAVVARGADLCPR
ncbi:MAG TPA: hypothetical protein VFO66_07210 [Gemmatimonadaceae bacterium]|nr:hypothetical protein [Gemmatimonadaceae bacterium]